MGISSWARAYALLVAQTNDARNLPQANPGIGLLDEPVFDLIQGGAAPEPDRPADRTWIDGDATSPEIERFEPSMPDLEAAVELVSEGLARRVVLTGYPSRPGLLRHTYRLAESAGVSILPTVARPGGRVDIEVSRGGEAHG
jgi:hypothetical protein